jgi:hypothetical protein
LPDPANKSEYKQCIFGMEKSGSSAQGTKPGNGWYVLARMAQSDGREHLCKLYHENSSGARLYDLTCDPNEKVDLTAGPGYGFGHYKPGYCTLRVCTGDSGERFGDVCADSSACGEGTCTLSSRCSSGENKDLPCRTNADCGSGTCGRLCVGGINSGLSCTTEAQCPGGSCGRDLAGLSKVCSVGGQPCAQDSDCATGTCNFRKTCADSGQPCVVNNDCPGTSGPCRYEEYCRANRTTLERLLYYTAEKRDWRRVAGGNAVWTEAQCP